MRVFYVIYRKKCLTQIKFLVNVAITNSFHNWILNFNSLSVLKGHLLAFYLELIIKVQERLHSGSSILPKS